MPDDPVWGGAHLRLADEHLHARPCRTIQCPSDCWHCGVTTDGRGNCFLNDTCGVVNNKVGQRGGGESGCSCATGGGPPRGGLAGHRARPGPLRPRRPLALRAASRPLEC